MGEIAVDMLVSQIERQSAPPREIAVEPDIVVRESTAPVFGHGHK
jgi:DNA-binding LacI/PurR family transcriptional regulator